MTFKDFKKHFQDRAIKEYGFKKEGSRVYYTNDEVIIVFDIVKSGYGNLLSRFEIGVNPLEMVEKWGIYKPLTCDGSFLGASLGGTYKELDDYEDFEEYDKLFDDFFQNNFPKWLSVSSIKEMLKSGEIYPWPHIKEFWNIK